MEPFFAELWNAAKQAGPFATLFLLAACYLMRSDLKEERKRADAAEQRATAGLQAAANAINYMRISKGLEPQDQSGADR